MHPMPPAMASDLMRDRTSGRRPTVSRRRVVARRRSHHEVGRHAPTRVRAWAGWQLVRVGLHLVTSP